MQRHSKEVIHAQRAKENVGKRRAAIWEKGLPAGESHPCTSLRKRTRSVLNSTEATVVEAELNGQDRESCHRERRPREPR